MPLLGRNFGCSAGFQPSLMRSIKVRGSPVPLPPPPKAPPLRKMTLRQQWWMDIINVVHLLTFYSAILENEGSTAKGKCAYFGTRLPESYTPGPHSIRPHDKLAGTWCWSWSRFPKNKMQTIRRPLCFIDLLFISLLLTVPVEHGVLRSESDYGFYCLKLRF